MAKANIRQVTDHPRLTQSRMAAYLQLEANFKLIEKRFEDEKEALIKLFKDNPDLEQEPGRLEGKLIETPQHRPAWKEEYVKIAGKEAAEKVIASTPATFRHKIDIKVRATVDV